MDVMEGGAGREAPFMQRFPMFRFGGNANEAMAQPYRDLLRGRVSEHLDTLVQYLYMGAFYATIVSPFYEHISKVPLMQQFLEDILFITIYALFDPTLHNIYKIYMCANACICLVRSIIPKNIALCLITVLLTISSRFGAFGSTIFFEDSFISYVRQYNQEIKLTSLDVMMWAFAAFFIFFGEFSFEDFALPFVFYATLEYMDKGFLPISYAILALIVSYGWAVIKCARKNPNQQVQSRSSIQDSELMGGVVREIMTEYRSRQ